MTFTRSQYAMAASLAALVVAAPMALRLVEAPRGDAGSAERPIERDGGPSDDIRPEAAKAKRVEENAGGERREIAGLDQERQRAATALSEKPADLRKAEQDRRLERPAPRPSKEDRTLALAPSQPAPPPLPAIADGAGATAGSTVPASPATVAQVPLLSAQGRLGGEVAGLIDLENGRDAAAMDEHRDRFAAGAINPVKQVAREPVSTFSIDVDTVSYAFARRSLNAGRLPPQAAVRAEEMINYFDYDYAPAESAAQPFKPTVTVVPSPWNAANKIVHIGIKGYELRGAERPRANLVLLVDVSGSMAPDDRLPLVRNGLRMLVDELKPDDTVAIVTYASGSGIALEPTKVSDKAKIRAAIDMLRAGGSTAGASGIQDAYRLAAANFDKAGVNRVILATDGDFNVGITDQDALKGMIEREREKGIFLSILGVGAGNLNDSLMQTLAQNGNGVAAYADTLNEARKVLVEEASSTIFPIAKDVKIQVEWNPARVAEYRLVGYETRALKEADFNNDRVDAGDIGSGHTVTAIYEITPAGSDKKLVDDLRYAKPGNAPAGDAGNASELGFLKMRFKQPNAEISQPVSLAITDAASRGALADAPADVRFSIAVAGFAELLRGAPFQSGFGFDDVLEIAAAARGDDPFGQRSEFLNLVRLAKAAQR